MTIPMDTSMLRMYLLVNSQVHIMVRRFGGTGMVAHGIVVKADLKISLSPGIV